MPHAGFVCFVLAIAGCLGFVVPLRFLCRRTNRGGEGDSRKNETVGEQAAADKTLSDVLFGRVDRFVEWLVSATRMYIIDRNKIRSSKAYTRWVKAKKDLQKAVGGLDNFKDTVNELRVGWCSCKGGPKISSFDQHLKDGAKSISTMDSALEARVATSVHFGSQRVDQRLLRGGFFVTRFVWQLSLCSGHFVVVVVSVQFVPCVYTHTLKCNFSLIGPYHRLSGFQVIQAALRRAPCGQVA